IVTDNAAGSPQTVGLIGTGTAPAITVTPGSLTFPGTNIGATANSQAFTVMNSGTAAMTISNIAVSGGSTAAFSQTNNCPGALAAGASCAVTVTFTPNASGTLSSTVAITDNAPVSPQSFTVSGLGIGAVAMLSGS